MIDLPPGAHTHPGIDLGNDILTKARFRRLILTEIAEVWSRRNHRARLLAQVEKTAGSSAEVRRDLGALRDIRLARLNADRVHLASLRRLLAETQP